MTVTVSDVGGVSEPAGGDLPQDLGTEGEVLVDEGVVTGRIESVSDQDWFAVELVGGRTYVIEQRGRPTGDGTLEDPYFFGVYDPAGGRIADTTAADGGCRTTAAWEFTAPVDGAVLRLGGRGRLGPVGLGTYALEVRDAGAPVFASRSHAFTLSETWMAA